MKPTVLSFPSILLSTLIITGCAGSGGQYRPIIDGPKDQKYTADLSACQSLAKERSYTNGDVKSEALAGAIVGAIIGAIEDDSDSAAGGAVAGALLGGGGRSWDVRDERKSIIIKCMEGRGHNVLG